MRDLTGLAENLDLTYADRLNKLLAHLSYRRSTFGMDWNDETMFLHLKEIWDSFHQGSPEAAAPLV